MLAFLQLFLCYMYNMYHHVAWVHLLDAKVTAAGMETHG